MDKHEIENILNNTPPIEPGPNLKDKLQKDLDWLKESGSVGTLYLSTQPRYSPWLSRYAAAALFVIGFFLGMLALDDFSGGNVAWAEVATQSRYISKVHFYCFEFKKGGLKSSRESWYVDGKVVDLAGDNYRVDDGRNRIKYDANGNVLESRPSGLDGLAKVEGEQDPFKVLTQGVFAYTDQEIGNTLAVDIGEDLLVYRFNDPKNEMNIKEVIITVGRFSLLPIQMKIFFHDETDVYDMYVFDYEKKHMPVEVEKFLKSKVLPNTGNNEQI